VVLFPLVYQSLYSTNLCSVQMLSGRGGISYRPIQTKLEIRLNIILRNSTLIHIEETQLIPSLPCAT
jgi:hypothetical protein